MRLNQASLYKEAVSQRRLHQSGTFAVPGIPAGTYSVDVPRRGRDFDGGYVSDSDNLSFPADKCLAFLRQGDRDLLANPLQVGSQNVEITMGLRDESTRVRGTVRKPTGEAAPGVVVALLPDDRSRSADYFSVTTDQDGRFEFRCGQPGSFHLYAWSRLPGFAFRNAEFMKQYDDRGTPVTLETSVDRSEVVPLFDAP